ncbi:phage shock protein B [Thalassotalea sp. PS06]|uniref:phage shock protein B n=1 Tax=Thalassotalea sp. PS06 TaxID=2594005 RepID=UPI0011648414|nr:phage shock protein B [Thalassotalea sp. PS06]QDP00418.1 phage shock protein B [Thalassotalea sp. PS06]
MSVFNFVIIIVVCSLIYEYFNQRQKLQHNSKHSKKQHDELMNEIGELKTRVETLEKIVTDKGYDLKSEIDNL